MPRFRVTISANWIPAASRSLQNAMGAEAGTLAERVAKAEKHARYREDGDRLLLLEWADENRQAMGQLEEALDQIGRGERQRSAKDVVVDGEALVIRTILAGVLQLAVGPLLAMDESVPAQSLVDGRLYDLARMLGSVERSTSRKGSGARRRSTSPKPSA